jgi:hypothetical protein
MAETDKGPGNKTVNYMRSIGFLTAIVKKQNEQINRLAGIIEDMQAKLNMK